MSLMLSFKINRRISEYYELIDEQERREQTSAFEKNIYIIHSIAGGSIVQYIGQA